VRLGLVGFTAAAAGAALLLAVWPRGDQAITFAIEGAAGSPGAAAGAGSLMRFSDGSTVALARGARASVVATSAHGARVRLEEGEAALRILRRPGGEWALEAGSFRVTTAAARLDVAFRAGEGALAVVARAGAAAVTGPSLSVAGVRLKAGETLRAGGAEGNATITREGALAHSAEALRLRPPSGPAEVSADPESAAEPGPGEPVACRQPEPGAAARGLLSSGEARRQAVGGGASEPGGAGTRSLAGTAAAPWVRRDAGGCLRYAEDGRGNRIPDFSFSGYHGGAAAPPRIATAVGPLLPGSTGDDTALVQAAIDAVSARAPDEHGFRGAVELGAGIFTLRDSLRLHTSGVVLRGQGPEGPRATLLRAVGKPRTVIELGLPLPLLNPKSGAPIADDYVPVGARVLHLADAGDLKVGDDIVVVRPSTPRWAVALGTDRFPNQRQAKPWRVATQLWFERRITAREGARITVDVPLTNALEKEYGEAFVTRLEQPERIAEVGVEGVAGRAEFTEEGERASAVFVRVEAVTSGWLRNVSAERFSGTGFRLTENTKWFTIMDAAVAAAPLPEKGIIAFCLGGNQNLLYRSRSQGTNYRAVAMTAGVPGPNAVVDFQAVGKRVEVLTTRRWATGVLFDNVRVMDSAGGAGGEISVRNAQARAFSEGWTGANSVVWNSHAREIIVDNPPTAQNWVIAGDARSFSGTGTFSGVGAPASPASLYRAQLAERLGEAAAAATLK
jgi:hypothetical protein